ADVRTGDRAELVAHLERPEALLAGVPGADRVGGRALAADQLGGAAEPAVDQRGVVQGRHRARPLLIFPRTSRGRSWHLVGRASRARVVPNWLPGLRRAVSLCPSG